MNADIIIIGAGIAGLRCGIELLHKRPNATIVILEKYKYLGGRVVTYHTTLEDMEGRCAKLQWEQGAGRINQKHTKVLALAKAYNLTIYPLDSLLFYSDNGVIEENTFEDSLDAVVSQVKRLPANILANNTLRTIFYKIMGKNKTDAFFIRFPYRAEVNTLRADLGIHLFDNEMGSFSNYYRIHEGFSAIIDGMVKEFKSLGGKIFNKQDVIDIQKSNHMILVRTKTESGDVLWEAPKVICALHADALRGLSIFKEWDMLKRIKMEPLMRVYAVFPTENKKSWFSYNDRIVTANPLRYFIPYDITCGIAMISYTDGIDAERLIHVLEEKGEEEFEKFLMKYLRITFPDRKIPDPVFFKAHPWTSGCTYWLPGDYDPKQKSEEALQPFPDTIPGLYCCGESFSLKQEWMEGALEHADLLLSKHF